MCVWACVCVFVLSKEMIFDLCGTVVQLDFVCVNFEGQGQSSPSRDEKYATLPI